MHDSAEYLAKKSFFDKMLTLYGRNAVVEALEDRSLEIHRLHLSRSNRPAPQLDRMLTLAKERGVEVVYHDKKGLSRISKNAKQDQGVALDIIWDQAMSEQEFIAKHQAFRVMVLDGVVNPQNLGMIIRSCAAGNIDAIVLPQKNTAQISPLVIKASVGTLFRIPVIKSKDLIETLRYFQEHEGKIYTLSSHAKAFYKEVVYAPRSLFVLGNETHGVSEAVLKRSDYEIAIPMRRGVESLNVAVTASLLAFM